jgi:DDE superfamily endonuclease
VLLYGILLAVTHKTSCLLWASDGPMLDAVFGQCSRLDIVFPMAHDQQQQIARDFKAKLFARFGCCVGAVDGILFWISRPSEEEAKLAGCGPSKFFCGRKHKFGLNCQAICDARGKFLDMSVMYPGLTSDVLAFEGASIYWRLQGGLLAPGMFLVLTCCFVTNH